MHFSLKALILCVIIAIVANDLFVYANYGDDDDDNDKPTIEADTEVIVDWVIILLNHFIVIVIRF